MSTKRIREIAPLQKGPNGRNLCRFCSKEVSPPRRTFCSNECVHEFEVRTNVGYVRHCLKRRDRGICAKCGLDCIALRRELFKIYNRDREAWKKEVISLKIPKNRIHKSLWDADHIIEVVNGGGDCGLENFQTLCIWCHRLKTNGLMKVRRELRKLGKLPPVKKRAKTGKKKSKGQRGW